MVAFYFENQHSKRKKEMKQSGCRFSLEKQTNKKILKPNSDIHNNFLNLTPFLFC